MQFRGARQLLAGLTAASMLLSSDSFVLLPASSSPSFCFSSTIKSRSHPSMAPSKAGLCRNHRGAHGMSMTINRRDALALVAGFSFPTWAFADSTGKFSSKRTAKNRYVPRVKKGLEIIDGIESGVATFDQLLEIESDMVNAMKLYGDAQKKSEVPDKISIRLNKDADAFSLAVKGAKSDGDIAKVKASWQTYYDHLPRDGKEPFTSGLAPGVAK